MTTIAAEEEDDDDDNKDDSEATRMTTTMSGQQATINPLNHNQQWTREAVARDNDSGSGGGVG